MELILDSYNNIYICQNRDYWESCPFEYNRLTDLVLTVDFALVKKIEGTGGHAGYVDHIADNFLLEDINHELYRFFSKWNQKEDGSDIFTLNSLSFGDSLNISIWNDLTYSARLLANLLELKKYSFNQLHVGTEDKAVHEICRRLFKDYETWDIGLQRKYAEYSFPIFKWMDENIYPSGIKEKIKKYLNKTVQLAKKIASIIPTLKKNGEDVFIHRYHPTEEIIKRLKEDRRYNVILESHTWKKGILREERIPNDGDAGSYEAIANELVKKFKVLKSATFSIGGVEFSDILYALIIKRIQAILPRCLKIADAVSIFLDKRNLKLAISITNIGFMNRIVQKYCQLHHIPTYFIINGLLTYSFLDDAKDGTWINAYGESIKKLYFKDKENVVTIGDPRMDAYAKAPKRKINHNEPTIICGAAGFDNVDLNSYIAYEFDFFNDIVRTCANLKANGRNMKFAIKVRPNGYSYQYRDFLAEYYPDFDATIYDDVPMSFVYERADLYISIYSQTLFEASCNGIPVIYYKKDTQILHSPFDAKAELVTACTTEELHSAIEKFYAQDEIYNPFLKYEIMEKYVGPLDGKNLERNLKHIYGVLEGDLKSCSDGVAVGSSI